MKVTARQPRFAAHQQAPAGAATRAPRLRTPLRLPSVVHRVIVAIATAVALIVGLGTGAAAVAAPAVAGIESVAAKEVFNREAEVGMVATTKRTNPRTRASESLVVAVSSSVGGMFSAVSVNTGTNILTQQLATDGKTRTSRAMVTMPNGDIYVTTTLGELFRFDPTPEVPTLTEMPKLLAAFPNAQVESVGGVLSIISATSSAVGQRVYVGTTSGRVYAFDTVAWSRGLAPWSDLGRVSSSADPASPLNANLYVNGLATYRNSDGAEILYAGVGATTPGLWSKVVSQPSSAWVLQPIDDSPGMSGAGSVTLVSVVGHYLYVTYSARGAATHVQRLDGGTWIDKEDPMWIVTAGPPGSPNVDLATTRTGGLGYNNLATYDPRSAKPGRGDRKRVGALMSGELPRSACWVSATVCVMYTPDGTLFLNDLQTGTYAKVGPSTSVIAAGYKNTSIMGLGPDDRVYVSSDYFSKTIARLPVGGTGEVDYLPNGPEGTNDLS